MSRIASSVRPSRLQTPPFGIEAALANTADGRNGGCLSRRDDRTLRQDDERDRGCEHHGGRRPPDDVGEASVDVTAEHELVVRDEH